MPKTIKYLIVNKARIEEATVFTLAEALEYIRIGFVALALKDNGTYKRVKEKNNVPQA